MRDILYLKDLIRIHFSFVVIALVYNYKMRMFTK